MTFEEAVLTAAKSVSEAPRNLTVEQFWKTITSLVVKETTFVENEYHAITVSEYRSIQKKKPRNMPKVVLTIASGDDFDREYTFIVVGRRVGQ